jgi:hypothetical protein
VTSHAFFRSNNIPKMLPIAFLNNGPD